MINNTEKYLEFLNELSEILFKKLSPFNTILSVKKLYKSYLDIEKSEFIIWDNDNFTLDEITEKRNINNKPSVTAQLYGNFILSSGNNFLFNDEEYSCNLKDNELVYIKENILEENNIIYPVVANGEVLGLINLKSSKQEFSKEYFSVLNTASKLVSGAIINYTLNEQMEISLNFYKAMKDIAKIIESQYELSYIIPLIGEMIDRFMASHLIYIFVYKENEYHLVWPNACKDEKINSILNKLDEQTEYVLSDDSKIAAFPIINDEGIVGAIAAYSNIDKLTKKEIDYLIQLTRQSGLTIQRANMYAEVLKYATMDALTGLNNRRQFETRLKQEVSNSKRNNIPMCCIMLDVDYFKKVNDTYGHSAGDCVLKSVSNVIQKEIREYDIACRWGGEEFFIILPQTTIKEAALVGQRLRKVIEDSKMDIREAKVAGVPHLQITISVGVCEYNKEMDSDEVVQKADQALYEAKRTGRNRVIVSGWN